MTKTVSAGPIASFVERCRDAVRWRVNLLRWRTLAWPARREGRAVVAQLAQMKAANPGRPLCGILLIEHIGDIIACEPIIGRMRTDHPMGFIVWVARPEYAPLLASHPQLDAVVFADSLLSVEEIVESHIFDVTLDLHVNGKPTQVAGLRYEKKTGDPAIDVKSYFDKGSLLSAFSLAAGLEPRPTASTMYLPSETVGAVDRLSLPEQFVVVHATPNYGDKDWTASKWRDLVRRILDRYDTRVIEVGLRSVVNLEDPRYRSLCGRLSIVETAEVIRRAAFFIGVDSGPAHMANAWRRPALVLVGRFFGRDTFNPFDGYFAENADKVILRYPGLLREQPVDAVVDALETSPMWRKAVGQPHAIGGESRW